MVRDGWRLKARLTYWKGGKLMKVCRAVVVEVGEEIKVSSFCEKLLTDLTVLSSKEELVSRKE